MNRTNKNKCDVHFFTDFDEYEYIRRKIYDESNGKKESIADANRKLWFTKGWRGRLALKRLTHRNCGLRDQKFWHPKQIEQEGKK